MEITQENNQPPKSNGVEKFDIERCWIVLKREVEAWLVFKPNVYKIFDLIQNNQEAFGGLFTLGTDKFEIILKFLTAHVERFRKGEIVLHVQDTLKGENPKDKETVYGYDEYNDEWVRVTASYSFVKRKYGFRFVEGLHLYEQGQMHRWTRLPELQMTDEES